MPIREPSLANGYYYHVFNRGLEKRPIFTDTNEYNRFLSAVNYYRFSDTSLRLTNFLKLTPEQKEKLETTFSDGMVSIISYVLMPNHFHFLIKQLKDNGISEFIGNLSDSYTRYFNIKNNRQGNLFQGRFKSVLIESEEQLFHVSRYIHLNPYSAHLVNDIDELFKYPWSSLPEYTENSKGFCEKNIILDSFPTKEHYLQFILDRADYQRKLSDIKHLILE